MRILRLNEVLHMTGLSRSLLYKLSQEGCFPKQIPLGGRAVGWLEQEVTDWILSRIAQRDEEV